MEKYCCFCCPSKDYEEKNLEDVCPRCSNAYGFPLTHFPKSIAGIKIVKALDRGFYGATYVGETTPFGKSIIKKVIKIIPVELYKHHNKNFQEECDMHLELSENSTHFVRIDSSIYFENLEIEFTNGVKVNCHVIGLEFIDGITLRNILKTKK